MRRGDGECQRNSPSTNARIRNAITRIVGVRLCPESKQATNPPQDSNASPMVLFLCDKHISTKRSTISVAIMLGVTNECNISASVFCWRLVGTYLKHDLYSRPHVMLLASERIVHTRANASVMYSKTAWMQFCDYVGNDEGHHELSACVHIGHRTSTLISCNLPEFP